MNKKDVIKLLSEAEPASGIMEIICDIASNGQVCYPDESILVMLWGYGDDDSACADDQIINSKHYTICAGVKDFKEGIVFGHAAARKAYCNYYVSEFKEVKEFVSDFPQPHGTTTEEYLRRHPGVTLEMAPITGGADTQLWDYMDSMCTSLSVGKVPDASVFSYHHSIVLLRQTNKEICIRQLAGYLSASSVKHILDSLFVKTDEQLVASDWEDGSKKFFIMKSGNVFMPDYYESSEPPLHNYGYIRCIHCSCPVSMRKDIITIRQYLEEGNDAGDYDGVCTTERIYNDVKFYYWYKKDKYNNGNN